MNLELICRKTVEAARKTGEYIRSQKTQLKQENINTKGLHDYVTEVDTTSERKLIALLQALVPQAGFIAEEETTSQTSESYNWIIDPLDGTTNFIHQIEPFAISIALQKDNATILGVVYEVGRDECFYAWQGSKAFCNGSEISVSNRKTVNESLVATGFPYSEFSRLKPYLEVLEHFARNARGVRRLGSAATDLAYIACGRFDVFYEYNLKAWDVAAGAFLVKQAGGCVSDFSGNENYIYGKEILAANPNVFENSLKIVKEKMTA